MGDGEQTDSRSDVVANGAQAMFPVLSPRQTGKDHSQAVRECFKCPVASPLYQDDLSGGFPGRVTRK